MAPPPVTGTRSPAGAHSSDNAQGSGVSVVGVMRNTSIPAWVIVLIVVIVAVGLLRGLLALVALAFSGFVLIVFTIPALVSGYPGLAVGLVSAAAIIFVALYLAHGPSMRTSVALIGTLFGIAITAAIAQGAVGSTHLAGVAGDGAGTLTMLANTIDFRGLLTCAIIIAGLGVLNDVTITQASAVWELRAAAPAMPRRQIFAGAMRIGRDHIASTIYTIVFAYAGAAMTSLILLYLYNRPVLMLLSQEDIATEIVRTICSAIGLVLAVPLTTAIATLVVPPQHSPRAARHSHDGLGLLRAVSNR